MTWSTLNPLGRSKNGPRSYKRIGFLPDGCWSSLGQGRTSWSSTAVLHWQPKEFSSSLSWSRRKKWSCPLGSRQSAVQIGRGPGSQIQGSPHTMQEKQVFQDSRKWLANLEGQWQNSTLFMHSLTNPNMELENRICGKKRRAFSNVPSSSLSGIQGLLLSLNNNSTLLAQEKLLFAQKPFGESMKQSWSNELLR